MCGWDLSYNECKKSREVDKMENVLDVLAYPKDKVALDQAIQTITHQPATYAPQLVDLFAEAQKDGAAFDEPRVDLMVAAYVLAQLRVKEAFPVLLDLLSLPDVDQSVFFKELLAEEMQRILASIYDEAHQDQLVALILNLKADIYAVLAAINTLIIRYISQQFDRTELVTLVDHIIRTHPSPDLVILTSLVATDAGLVEVFPSIELAIDSGRADLEVFSEEELRRGMSRSHKTNCSKLKAHRLYQLIEDASTDLLRYDRFSR